MDKIISWKKRRDKLHGDNVSGMGDIVEEFSDCECIGLTGSPKGVKFIRKDETNFKALKLMKGRFKL